MGNEKLQIDKAHAKIFARAIYRDIAAYIDSHQEEYQVFLREEMEAQYANDIDEVFESGWRKKLEDAWKNEYTRAKYKYSLRKSNWIRKTPRLPINNNWQAGHLVIMITVCCLMG